MYKKDIKITRIGKGRFRGEFSNSSKLRTPTKLDIFLAYITLAIPAAMLARVTRILTGRKGTPLEGFCMEYYYDQSVKLLAKDS
jgi:hypothetical protein